MNKQKIGSHLKKLGFQVDEFNFSYVGYQLIVRLNPKVCLGWEELEHEPFQGLEIIRTRQISPYVKEVIFFPTSHKELNDYIRRYCNLYCMSKKLAIVDIEIIVQEYGNRDVIDSFNKYKESIKE